MGVMGCYGIELNNKNTFNEKKISFKKYPEK